MSNLIPSVVVLGGTGALGSCLVQQWLEHTAGEVHVVRVGSKPVPRGHDEELVEVGWDPTIQPLSFSQLAGIFDGSEGRYPWLVINAIGVNQVLETPELMMHTWQQLLAVNVWPTVAVVKALLQAPMPEGVRPTLVSVGSSACDGAGAHSLAYVSAKHALTGVTRSLARDMKGRINVLQVNPPKLDDPGSRMSKLIDNRQAELRGTTVEAEKRRQAASSPSGEGYPTSETVARWIYHLLRDPQDHQHLHGTVVRIGYAS